MVGAPPLTGIKVLEFAGLAPGPFAGMTLADAGASVLRVNRHDDPPQDMLARRKASVAVDLKDPRGVAFLRHLVASAPVDVLIDPFRPGVLERLGLGPDALLRLHPGLVYARVTGYRRDGRYAAMAGHDINYLAVSGALSLLGPPDRAPQPPVNILGDFAGGGATLVQGILLALLARARSATPAAGQVVEANMVDGSAYLASFPRMARATPLADKPRGRNPLDAVECPWYACYATADARWLAVGALEPRFFAALLRGLGLAGQGWEDDRADEARWPELRALLAARFAARTRAEWEAVFDGTDACVAPVLDYDELRADPRREGDQRPAVTLRDTPWYAVHRAGGGGGGGAADVADRGQGDGVEGDGYDPTLLDVGEGGDEMLGEWLGWKRGTHYEDGNGRGLTLINDKAKI